jgi:dTDP-4-dehydrorhamnose reductase
MRRVLVLGGDSYLGSSITRALSAKHYVKSTTRRSGKGLFLNALNPRDHNLNLKEFDVVINVIGITSFAECDANPSISVKINVDFPVEFVRQLNSKNQTFIQLSSSAVFSCDTSLQTDDSPKLPKSEYGKQKLNAETELKAFDCVKILRLSKIVTPNDIIGKKIKRLRAGKPESAFCDLFFCPIDIGTFTSALGLMIEESSSQVFQISGKTDLNYFEALRHLCFTFGLDVSLLAPSSCHEVVSSRNILRHTSMLTSKLFEPLFFKGFHPFWSLEKCYE